MKNMTLLLLAVAIAALTIGSTTSCKDLVKSETGTLSDSDSVAAAPTELPRTLADAPTPKGNITTWLLAGMLEDGGYRMFIVEGDESRFVEDHLGTTDTLYTLRLVSYEQTKDEKEQLEEGGTSEDIEGNLVVDAYDYKTQAFVGRYEGQYTNSGEYDAEGELLHCGESYGGILTHADGTTEEFYFYGD